MGHKKKTKTYLRANRPYQELIAIGAKHPHCKTRYNTLQHTLHHALQRKHTHEPIDLNKSSWTLAQNICTLPEFVNKRNSFWI